MKLKARNFRKQWRKLTKPEIIRLSGVSVRVDRERLPAEICDLLIGEGYESAERAVIPQVVRPSDRVVDIGAGIGLTSLVTASICGDANTRIYEANPLMRPVIEDNFALNGMTPQLVNRAVAPVAGEAVFYFSDNIISSGLVDRGLGREERVLCDGIEDVIGEFRPTVLVMDVEGAEVEILATSRLEGVRAIILETHAKIRGDDAMAALARDLESKGFTKDEAVSKGKVWSFLRELSPGAV